VAAAASACLLAGAQAAVADTSPSQNWAGYAAHGTTFEAVSARWHQPRASCSRGQKKYSAMWVGLGGYSLNSSALEQVGTELDCSTSGHPSSSTWYELVPGPSEPIHLGIREGDLIAAAVSVVGAKVTVEIQDLTRHTQFLKVLNDSMVDVSSAEWILEAPSACFDGTSSCHTLPLTNFRHAAFTETRATMLSGQAQPIASSAWTHTRIILGPVGTQFVSNRLGSTAVGTARPSALLNGGSSFKIAYKREYVRSTFGGRAVRSGPTYLRH
jgi:Peptidase A4 family